MHTTLVLMENIEKFTHNNLDNHFEVDPSRKIIRVQRICSQSQ